MNIVVTGATGYIGQRLVARALAEGHVVVAASRRQPPGGLPWVRFDLADAATFGLLAGIDALVHLAANTSAQGGADAADELRAADALIEATRAVGARLVFVSSQAASEDAPTAYGRVKWQIECKVLAAGGVVVRLGQVYGGREEGLFGTLAGLARKLPVLPAFVPAPAVQPIHVDDCAAGLLALAEGKGDGPGVYALGAPESVSFTAFLWAIAHYRVRRVRLFVPVPVLLMRVLIKALSLVSPSAFGLARLESLFALPPLPPVGDLAALGLHLRPLGAGMHPSGDNRRRLLAIEGVALLTYILRAKPRLGLVRRYIRMVEALRAGKPAGLPAWIYRRPLLLACLDGRGADVSSVITELRWRIGAAMPIAEASVQGFQRFLAGGRPSPPLVAFACVGMAVMSEAGVRLGALFLLPLLRLAARRGEG